MKSNITCVAVTFALSVVSSIASAALIDRGRGLIYDTDLNITWLANADLAATNNFGVGGINPDSSMTWTTATSWISAMNAANYLGYSGWRLPTTIQPDTSCDLSINAGPPYGVQGYGFNCTGSEMGHLFYSELGGVGGDSILTSNDPDLTLFQNIRAFATLDYWSGTEYAPSTGNVWAFGFHGSQYAISKSVDLLAWAVLPGDVAAVPLPAAVWLFGTGLFGLIGVARRKTTGSMYE